MEITHRKLAQHQISKVINHPNQINQRILLTSAYKRLPCWVLPPTGQNPLIFKLLRAFLHALAHLLSLEF